MSDPRPPYAPTQRQRPRPLHAVTYYWGVAILLLGLAAAALIYVFAADDGDTDLSGEIESSRMYEHNLELMGGKFAVYVDRFNHWFSGLWHGRPLAYTVAVLAVVIALVCFWWGRLTSVPSGPEQEREG